MDILIGLVMAAMIMAGVFVGYHLWDDWAHGHDEAKAHHAGDIVHVWAVLQAKAPHAVYAYVS